jgi:hypothetical protein
MCKVGKGKGRKTKTWKSLICLLQKSNIVIFNWQRQLWEGDQKVANSSGRDKQCGLQHTCAWKQCQESLYIVIFISNYQKCYAFLIISYVFSSTILEKKRAELVLPRIGDRGWRWPKQCIHIWVNVKMVK